ncbi:MAG: hypothetical protein CVT48_00495 [Thermoplasmata archaeon HGW-Thermoplasmata-1]|nr:MAG: hypothetical protein CVT48_00495 [Thermoplasmata archaeon HGW-Thermoplasmata-1]
MIELDPLIIFAIILVVGLAIPEFSRKVKVTYVPFYIVAGLLLGPFVIGISIPSALEFIADIGVLLLVFIAGLEIHEIRRGGGGGFKQAALFSFISASVCFLAGSAFGLTLGYSLLSSLLVGAVLMSSSVGEIIPIVNDTPYLQRRFGDLIPLSIILMDGASLLLLAFITQAGNGAQPYMRLIGGLALLFFLIAFVLPPVSRWFFRISKKRSGEADLVFMLLTLVAFVAIGELVHIHGIVIAFFAGAVLGKHIPSERTYIKLRGIAYGIFIPVFFVVLGMGLDLSVLSAGVGFKLIIPLIFTLQASKILGGLIFAKIKGLSFKEGVVAGITVWPQLSATLAATAVGYETGLFDEELVLAVVAMCLVTVLLTPFVIRFFTREKHDALRDANEHILIVGYGKVSSRLVGLLHIQNEDFVIIERKVSRIRSPMTQGMNVVHGDATEMETLRKASAQDANIAVVTIAGERDSYQCIEGIRKLNPSCYVIAVVHNMEQYERLEGLAHYRVWPEKLASTEIVKHVLEPETRDAHM